jgi:hypothetical protein
MQQYKPPEGQLINAQSILKEFGISGGTDPD